MKITINAKSALTALSNIAPIMTTKPKEDSKNISILADDSGVFISFENCSALISQKIEGGVINCGECSVDYKKIKSALKGFAPDSSITIYCSSNLITLSDNNMVLSVQAESFDDKVSADYTGVTINSFSIAPKKLLSFIKKVDYAAAKKDTRYYLNGLLFDFNAAGLKVVATDGHRLAMVNTDTGSFKDNRSIVCIKDAAMIKNILKKSKDEIEVSFSLFFITLKSLEFNIQLKLIDSKYPDIDRVIPEFSSQDSVIINRLSFISIIKSALLATSAEGGKIAIENNALSLLVNDSCINCFSSALDCVNYKDVEIGLNLKYLLDALKNETGEKVNIQIKDSMTSALINKGALIMPMHV